ncbi:MAG: hypothetical protein QNJ90_15125 [Planctomycetota bacterium]|nr:hypothetical protein [Planctomycetota bacterium]
MATTLLTEAAFKATFTRRMREITGREQGVLDIWAYVDAIPLEQREGLELTGEDVTIVWRDAYDRYDHVLIPLARSNTYLVVVVDLRMVQVHGHHVLDLGAFYGDA